MIPVAIKWSGTTTLTSSDVRSTTQNRPPSGPTNSSCAAGAPRPGFNHIQRQHSSSLRRSLQVDGPLKALEVAEYVEIRVTRRRSRLTLWLHPLVGSLKYRGAGVRSATDSSRVFVLAEVSNLSSLVQFWTSSFPRWSVSWCWENGRPQARTQTTPPGRRSVGKPQELKCRQGGGKQEQHRCRRHACRASTCLRLPLHINQNKGNDNQPECNDSPLPEHPLRQP